VLATYVGTVHSSFTWFIFSVKLSSNNYTHLGENVRHIFVFDRELFHLHSRRLLRSLDKLDIDRCDK
jgi:hypothetical protein